MRPGAREADASTTQSPCTNCIQLPFGAANHVAGVHPMHRDNQIGLPAFT